MLTKAQLHGMNQSETVHDYPQGSIEWFVLNSYPAEDIKKVTVHGLYVTVTLENSLVTYEVEVSRRKIVDTWEAAHKSYHELVDMAWDLGLAGY